MIEKFKDNEVRNTGIIYSSTFEQIKKLYAMSPEQAGEFAIAAIELVLTGEVSSDDYMIELMLEPTKKLNENNRNKYESKVENARNKKITDMKLDKIAEMANKGMRQREIGEKLGLSQQIISYRMGIIRTQFPDLLDESPHKNTSNSTKIQINEPEISQTVYKNTNDTNSTNNTNNENFVQICTNDGVCRTGETKKKFDREEMKKKGFDF